MKNERDMNEEIIRLAHGGGGRLMRELVRDLFAATFADGGAQAVLEDAATLDLSDEGGRVAFTTDTFVVSPLFFPGGNIGDLAINGTVNDLAMMGAKPKYLSVAMILEEGLPMAQLREIVATMKTAATAAGVRVVTGDTKVVARGQGDGVYINTTGLGMIPRGLALSAAAVRPGDVIIVSGPIGDHGVAVMSKRGGLSFQAALESDTAPLHDLVATMLESGATLRFMRDPTRGGLGAVMNELSEDSKVTIRLDEEAIPVRAVVRAACETLGLDPLHVPCEGRLVVAVDRADAEKLLAAMRAHPRGAGATIIGEALGSDRPEVILRTTVGGERVVDLPAGELLPRIC